MSKDFFTELEKELAQNYENASSFLATLDDDEALETFARLLGSRGFVFSVVASKDVLVKSKSHPDGVQPTMTYSNTPDKSWDNKLLVLHDAMIDRISKHRDQS